MNFTHVLGILNCRTWLKHMCTVLVEMGRAGASGTAISFWDREEREYQGISQKADQQSIPEVTGHPFESMHIAYGPKPYRKGHQGHSTMAGGAQFHQGRKPSFRRRVNKYSILIFLLANRKLIFIME